MKDIHVHGSVLKAKTLKGSIISEECLYTIGINLYSYTIYKT